MAVSILINNEEAFHVNILIAIYISHPKIMFAQSYLNRSEKMLNVKMSKCENVNDTKPFMVGQDINFLPF